MKDSDTCDKKTNAIINRLFAKINHFKVFFLKSVI